MYDKFLWVRAAAAAEGKVGGVKEAAADAVHAVRDLPQAAAEEGVPAQQGAALRRQPHGPGRAPASWR